MNIKTNRLSVYAPLRTQTQYLKLIAACVINRFGDSIDAIAFSLLTYAITGSPSLMALVLAVNYLPTMLLQPIAGVLTERMNPRRVMVLCDLGRGMSVLAIAVLHAAGRLSTPLIIVAVLVQSTLEALATPSGVSIVPRLLASELYTPGVALRNTLAHVTELIGLACAGAVVGSLGIAAALAIDASTFFLSAALIATLRMAPVEVQPSAEKNGVRRVLTGLREGLVALWQVPALRALSLLGMALNFICVPYSVFNTAYVTDSLGGGAAALSLMEIAFVLGSILGSWAAPMLDGTPRFQTLIGGIGTALSYAAFALLPRVPGTALRLGLTVPINLLLGACTAQLSVLFSSTFMRSVPRERLSRFSGIFNGLLTCVMPVGALLCSGLVRFCSVPEAMMIAAGLCALLFLGISRQRTFDETP